MQSLNDMAVLVVDDETTVLEALSVLDRQSCDACLVDVHMPGMDGIELLRRIKRSGYPTEVIVFTGYATVQSAVEAIRLGACDYLRKPVTAADLSTPLSRLRARRRPSPGGDADPEEEPGRFIGEHPSMREVRRRIACAALNEATVLITGESGTGKELVARAVHEGGRSGGPFIRVHCGALSHEGLRGAARCLRSDRLHAASV